MALRRLVSGVVIPLAVIIGITLPMVASRQTLHRRSATTPRTSWGHPDFEGIWSTATVTPLERPAGQKEFLTQQEAAEVERRAVEEDREYRDRDMGTKVVPTLRTSLVVDPRDGRIPALTPEARNREIARAEARKAHLADNPEDLSLWERCITFGVPAVMLPKVYNNNYQIVQTPDYVVIHAEMIHDVRIIPLDGRPHLPRHLPQWLGDSVGHWEGDTLVVVTTNFTNKTDFWGAGENLRLVERFTRTGPDILLYQLTVLDRTTFTRPWTVELPATRSEGPIYEYACHEGNYSLEGMLRGARAEERRGPESGAKPVLLDQIAKLTKAQPK